MQSDGLPLRRAPECRQGHGLTIDGRMTRRKSYQTSQVIRKHIEEVFGWAKSANGLRKAGIVSWIASDGSSASSWRPTTWIRLPKLLA